MARYASSRRYAQAVFQIAQEHGDIDAWLDDARALAELTDDPAAAEFLDAPQIPDAKKLQTIQQTLGDSVNPLALNLLGLLAARRLTHIMPDVLSQLTDMVDQHRGVQWADVTTAVPMDDERTTEIAELIGGIVGGKVSLRTYVEPDIIGGLIVRVGDRVIDGSVRAKMRNMEREIVERIT